MVFKNLDILHLGLKTKTAGTGNGTLQFSPSIGIRIGREWT
jgi:hypothetical protein